MLQQRNNVFVASDTAISGFIGGQRVRLANSAEKVFVKGNDIIFCSGNMEIANQCKNYIKHMSFLDIEKVRDFASSFCFDDMFEIFIAKTNNNIVESYQLSSYNNFSPIKRVVHSGNTEIFAIGYNTSEMLSSFEENLATTSVLNAIENTFNSNICPEVGGNVDLFYFYNGRLCQKTYELIDKHKCLAPMIDSKYCSLVIANSIVGKLLLGDKLMIGNEDNTFIINPNGLSIYDASNLNKERIFLGIEKVNGVKKARLRLHSAKDDKKLVLSEDGIYNVISVHGADNFDKNYGLECSFYISDNIQAIHDFNVRVRLSKFRGYSKSASTTKTTTKATTTKATGGSSYTSTSSGKELSITTTSKATTKTPSNFFTSIPQLVDGSLEDTDKNFLRNHQHIVYDESWINHQHTIDASIASHNHTFTLPTHDHSVDLVIDGHSHALEYGIYTYSVAPTVNIYLDSTLIASNVTSSKTYDLSSKIQTLTTGWHTLKVIGVGTSTNENGLGRASIDATIGAFVTFQ